MNDRAPTLFGDELPQEPTEQVIFDYRLLSAEKREFVLLKTDETQWLLKKTAENIIKIGNNLRAVKKVLPHGQFTPWIQSEFGGMTDRSARLFMNVDEKFGGKTENFSVFAPSVLYLLASPSTPESAIDEAIQLAEEGKKVTHAMAQKLIAAEKAREEAEQRAADALAETRIAQQKLFGAQSEAHTRITELTQQIEAIQKEMVTLTTPPTEYVDKVVWPEEKVTELKRLQEQIATLNIDLEAKKEAIPEKTQKQLEVLQKRIDHLQDERRQQENINKSQKDRIGHLDDQLKIAIRDRIASENDERIRQEWRSINSEVHSCLMRLLGGWPSALDVRSFEADDWSRLDQLKSVLHRVIDECNNLHYGSDGMIVDTNPHALSVVDANQGIYP